MASLNILKAIEEINSIHFNHPSDWLDALKESAIEAVCENDPDLIEDNFNYCEMTKGDYSKFKATIKDESYYHDQWDVVNLERRIVRYSEEYANAWNKIVNILMEYGVDKINNIWISKATDEDILIDEFCHYDLPSSAKVGKSWELPKWFIQGNNSPEAPYWHFSFCEFTAYIKAVTPTDDPDILEIEYWVYRSNPAHCSGYYHKWDTGKARVNLATHRRWNVA